MHRSKVKSTMLKRVNIYIQLFILNLIDITAFGGGMMTADNKSELSSVSMLLTFLSLILSQINYNLFSRVPVAICAGPVLEATTLIRKLCTGISNKVSKEEMIINCLVAIAISTILFGIISIIFSIFDVSKYLFLIPHSVIAGILSGVGLMLIKMSFDLLKVNEPGKDKLGIYYFIFLLIFGLCLVAIEKKFGIDYFAPISVLIFTVVLFLIGKVFKIEKDTLLKYTIISSEVSLNEGMKILKNNLKFDFLNFKLILKEYPNILALTFFYLLHLPINISSYGKVTKVKYNLKKEFLTQGISNILGSVFVLPVYFVCCYSIMLAESGCSRFLDGIALSGVYSLNYFLAGAVRSYVPVIGLALFPVLIGYSFCISGVLMPYQDGSIIEFLIIWSIAIAGGVFEIPMYILFVLGIIASLCYFFASDVYFDDCRDAFNSEFMREFSKQYDYLKVDYLLYFLNANKFKEGINKLTKKIVIIDLISCGAFDMLGNEVFRDNLSENQTYFIIGSPYNFNIGPVSGMKNVYLCNDYLHTSEEIAEFLYQ